MQNAVFDAMSGGTDDIVVLSPAGTGKTYAYLIPLASQLDSQSDALQAVVLLPGRELALQSANVLKSMGSGLRTMALYGGRPTMDEHRELRTVRPQIVFATPGRLNDHLDKGNISAASVRTLVIDEFDKMLQMGFQDEMTAIIGKLPTAIRRVLLSATDAEEIPSYSRSGFNPARLNFIAADEAAAERVKIFKVQSPEKDKLETLEATAYRPWRAEQCRIPQLSGLRGAHRQLPYRRRIYRQSLPWRPRPAGPRKGPLPVQQRDCQHSRLHRPRQSRSRHPGHQEYHPLSHS